MSDRDHVTVVATDRSVPANLSCLFPIVFDMPDIFLRFIISVLHRIL